MEYIALPISHFGAIRFSRICQKEGWAFKMEPVPRSLSSSCGTCVRYSAPGPISSSAIPDEIERIARVVRHAGAQDRYEIVYSRDDG